MCHFPAEALFCRAVEKCFIYKLFSCAFFLSFKFIFLSALEKISTAEEMEASCWINSIMIFLQLSSTLVCCILHKRGREVERKHEISPLPVGMLETFLLTALNLSFSHTRKKSSSRVSTEKHFAIVCLYIRFGWLFYPEILCNHFLLLPPRLRSYTTTVKNLSSHLKDTKERGVDFVLPRSRFFTALMAKH